MRLKGIFLSFLFFLILNFHAQSVPLRFQGNVSDDRSKLSGVTLQVSKGGRVINNILTDGVGAYYFELPLGAEYMITVSKEGYVSKKFSVSTLGVPAEMTGIRFPSVEASLTLFKKMESVDYSLLNQPVNKFYFDVDNEDFVYDENHLKQMKKGIEQIKEQEKAVLAKEKERETQYQNAIKAGDKAFQKKEWEAAIGFYEQSLQVKTEEAYPREQIEKANIALSEAKNSKENTELAATKATKAAAAKALADKLAKEKEAADALAKKQADDAAAKALVDKQAKEKEAEDALAKKQAADLASAAAAKALLDKQNKEKAEADALIKKQTEEAAAKKAADDAATKAMVDKQAKEKAEAEALAKKQNDETSAKKATELAAAAALANKLAKEKEVADAAAKKASDEAAAKAIADKELLEKQEKDKAAKAKADEAAAKAKAAKTPTLSETDIKFNSAIKLADEAFAKRRFYDAKTLYEEALIIKSGDTYAKTRLVECEKNINADANQNVDERQKQLLAKYPPGVTEEVIPNESVVIIRRTVVKDRKAFVYEKKVFNWGGISCFRDGEPITELTFEQETRK